MYSTKLTSVWNQQTILFDERRIRRVWRAPNRLKVCWLLFFFQIQCSADDRSQQPTRIDNNWCALLWYTPSFWFLYEFCFLLKFKKFYFLFYTINKKTQLPPFWFHQGDVLCYDSSTCMCTYTQVVWIVPNHFEIHFFTFQIIFFFKFSYLLHSTGALMLICFYPGLSPYFLLSIVFCVQYLMWWRICSTV